MSFYRFNDTVTLYTLIEDGYYERRVVPAVKVQLTESENTEKTRVTVYIPIFGRRSLKYRALSENAKHDKSSFVVTPNQRLYLGFCPDDFPPEKSFTVSTVEAHLSGSRHVQHVKIVAYNIPSEEEIYDE